MSTHKGAPLLVLVPTALELARLLDLGGLGPSVLVDLCGFGPIAAGARTAQLLARLTPARVILVGIAGAYDIERDPLGSAIEFGAVAVTGVGFLFIIKQNKFHKCLIEFYNHLANQFPKSNTLVLNCCCFVKWPNLVVISADTIWQMK